MLQSFVMADIPGLIEGAAEGSGLGIKFLKHLQRTRILFHLVDILPEDEAMKPQKVFREIELELEKFSSELTSKSRWLVINKIDLLPEDKLNTLCNKLVKDLNWEGPVFRVSAISGEGCEDLAQAVIQEMELIKQD